LAEGEFYNYIFDERITSDPIFNDYPVKNYTFKLETLQGNGSLFVRRCKQVELGSTNLQTLDGCIIRDKATLEST